MVLRPKLDPSASGMPQTSPSPPSSSLDAPPSVDATERPAHAATPSQARPALAPALVTITIVALNVLVWLAMLGAGADAMGPSGEILVLWGADYGPLTLRGEYWRLLTSAFLHSGIIHLGMNMYVLWGAGQAVERIYGRTAYALVYLFAAVGGSATSLLLNPSVLSVGASGAVFGVVGAFGAFIFANRRVIKPEVRKQLMRNLGMFLLINIAFGFAVPRIDQGAHVGGFLAGALGGLLVAPAVTPKGPVFPRARYALLPVLTLLVVGAVVARGMFLPLPPLR